MSRTFGTFVVQEPRGYRCRLAKRSPQALCRKFGTNLGIVKRNLALHYGAQRKNRFRLASAPVWSEQERSSILT